MDRGFWGLEEQKEILQKAVDFICGASWVWDSLAKLFICLGQKNSSPVGHMDISDISPKFEMTGVQLSASEIII